MAANKNSASSTDESAVATIIPDGDAQDAAGRFVGQWNRLVSTTNWEKGRIICQWRAALIAAGAPVTDYSDEAWAQLVGGVTSQHVGRLRRVYDRFGAIHDQFEGLYWSHFQASLDWEDAEMWLEGAIHNGWSVSQMRGKRWETVGKPGETMPADDDAQQDDLQAEAEDAPFDADGGEQSAAITSTPSAVKPVDSPAKKDRDEEEDDADEDDGETASRSSSSADDYETPKSSAKSRNRLPVEVDELPEDIADAFEQFKLAIIAQRRLGWSETTPEAVLECLDALRELTLAPADN